MAQILVRNLDKKLVDRLKKRAKADGTSLQSEVKSILEDAARMDVETFLEWTDKFRARTKGRKVSDSALLIREDRDR